MGFRILACRWTPWLKSYCENTTTTTTTPTTSSYTAVTPRPARTKQAVTGRTKTTTKRTTYSLEQASSKSHAFLAVGRRGQRTGFQASCSTRRLQQILRPSFRSGEPALYGIDKVCLHLFVFLYRHSLSPPGLKGMFFTKFYSNQNLFFVPIRLS